MANMVYWRSSRSLYRTLSIKYTGCRPWAPIMRNFHDDDSGENIDFKKHLRQRLLKKDGSGTANNNTKLASGSKKTSPNIDAAALSKLSINKEINSLSNVVVSKKNSSDKSSTTDNKKLDSTKNMDNELDPNAMGVATRVKAFVASAEIKELVSKPKQKDTKRSTKTIESSKDKGVGFGKTKDSSYVGVKSVNPKIATNIKSVGDKLKDKVNKSTAAINEKNKLMQFSKNKFKSKSASDIKTLYSAQKDKATFLNATRKSFEASKAKATSEKSDKVKSSATNITANEKSGQAFNTQLKKDLSQDGAKPVKSKSTSDIKTVYSTQKDKAKTLNDSIKSAEASKAKTTFEKPAGDISKDKVMSSATNISANDKSSQASNTQLKKDSSQDGAKTVKSKSTSDIKTFYSTQKDKVKKSDTTLDASKKSVEASETKSAPDTVASVDKNKVKVNTSSTNINATNISFQAANTLFGTQKDIAKKSAEVSQDKTTSKKPFSGDKPKDKGNSSATNINAIKKSTEVSTQSKKDLTQDVKSRSSFDIKNLDSTSKDKVKQSDKTLNANKKPVNALSSRSIFEAIVSGDKIKVELNRSSTNINATKKSSQAPNTQMKKDSSQDGAKPVKSKSTSDIKSFDSKSKDEVKQSDTTVNANKKSSEELRTKGSTEIWGGKTNAKVTDLETDRNANEKSSKASKTESASISSQDGIKQSDGRTKKSLYNKKKRSESSKNTENKVSDKSQKAGGPVPWNEMFSELYKSRSRLANAKESNLYPKEFFQEKPVQYNKYESNLDKKPIQAKPSDEENENEPTNQIFSPTKSSKSQTNVEKESIQEKPRGEENNEPTSQTNIDKKSIQEKPSGEENKNQPTNQIKIFSPTESSKSQANIDKKSIKAEPSDEENKNQPTSQIKVFSPTKSSKSQTNEDKQSIQEKPSDKKYINEPTSQIKVLSPTKSLKSQTNVDKKPIQAEPSDEEKVNQPMSQIKIFSPTKSLKSQTNVEKKTIQAEPRDEKNKNQPTSQIKVSSPTKSLKSQTNVDKKPIQAEPSDEEKVNQPMSLIKIFSPTKSSKSQTNVDKKPIQAEPRDEKNKNEPTSQIKDFSPTESLKSQTSVDKKPIQAKPSDEENKNQPTSQIKVSLPTKSSIIQTNVEKKSIQEKPSDEEKKNEPTSQIKIFSPTKSLKIQTNIDKTPILAKPSANESTSKNESTSQTYFSPKAETPKSQSQTKAVSDLSSKISNSTSKTLPNQPKCKSTRLQRKNLAKLNQSQAKASRSQSKSKAESERAAMAVEGLANPKRFSSENKDKPIQNQPDIKSSASNLNKASKDKINSSSVLKSNQNSDVIFKITATPNSDQKSSKAKDVQSQSSKSPTTTKTIKASKVTDISSKMDMQTSSKIKATEDKAKNDSNDATKKNIKVRGYLSYDKNQLETKANAKGINVTSNPKNNPPAVKSMAKSSNPEESPQSSDSNVVDGTIKAEVIDIVHADTVAKVSGKVSETQSKADFSPDGISTDNVPNSRSHGMRVKGAQPPKQRGSVASIIQGKPGIELEYDTSLEKFVPKREKIEKRGKSISDLFKSKTPSTDVNSNSGIKESANSSDASSLDQTKNADNTTVGNVVSDKLCQKSPKSIAQSDVLGDCDSVSTASSSSRKDRTLRSYGKAEFMGSDESQMDAALVSNKFTNEADKKDKSDKKKPKTKKRSIVDPRPRVSVLPNRKLSLTQYLYDILTGRRGNNGRRGITTFAAVNARNTIPENSRQNRAKAISSSKRRSNRTSQKDDVYISTDLAKRGLGAATIRRDRRNEYPDTNVEGNKQSQWRFDALTEEPCSEYLIMPSLACMPDLLNTNRKMTTTLNDYHILGAGRPQANEVVVHFDDGNDDTKIRGGNSNKCEDKSPLAQLKKKRQENDIEILGGSDVCTKKKEGEEDSSNEVEYEKRSFSTLGRQLCQNLLLFIFRTDKKP